MQLTIGVAEWIRDEQGMYVGAMLWVVEDPDDESTKWDFYCGDRAGEAFVQQIPLNDAFPHGFQVSIQFEGQSLKGYSGVHPLRSYEGPQQVVLG